MSVSTWTRASSEPGSTSASPHQYGLNHLNPLPGLAIHSTESVAASLATSMPITHPTAALFGYLAATSGTSGCPWYTG